MPIFLELIERVNNGETFSINFEKRDMKVGKSYLIKNGEYDTSRQLFSAYDDVSDLHVVLHMIRDLYKSYKYSLPSERSDSKRRQYFKTLPADKLTDKQMAIGANREIARAQLEGFILCMILNGKFQWDESKLGKWFYQSKQDPDLVIMRSWIENN
jgi:hypothetical protein